MNPASFNKRFAAFFIDIVFLFLLHMVIGNLILSITPGDNDHYVAILGWSLNFSSPAHAITSLITISYFVILTSIWGTTLGKKLVGIQVVDSQNHTPSFYKVLLRETVGRMISIAFLGIGLIWVIFDNKKQGWHDKLAKTYVTSI